MKQTYPLSIMLAGLGVLSPTLLKPAMPITIKGHPARDASRHFGEVHEIVIQDGRSFVIGASGTGPPSVRPAGGRSGRGN